MPTGSIDQDLSIDVEDFLQDVIAGLSAPQKSIPCKYLYDQEGSELFDQICEQPEYYLTRTERGILKSQADSIADRLGPNCLFIEPGSGSSSKTEVLLGALHSPAAYVPIDISGDYLYEIADGLREKFPDIEILPVAGDFHEPLHLPEPEKHADRRVVFFPGSTIGNLSETEARNLFTLFAELAGPGGALLIGIDLDKDRKTLEQAYDDSAGVTASFSLNLLERINRELDADFDVDKFAHRAKYNPDKQRVEISLVSQVDQEVSIGDQTFQFAAGEAIHTENSQKFSIASFAELASPAGWQLSQYWTDENEYFAILDFDLNVPAHQNGK